MIRQDDQSPAKDLTEAGPRLDSDPNHIDQCHSRWIDKLNRSAKDDSPDEWYSQQCGGCRFYIHLTGGFRSDWGVCTNGKSVRDGRATFEHDGCEHFVACDSGWS